MSKIRLTQPGWENYTGQMGVIFFEDGLSTTDVSHMDGTRVAAVMQCEWENGESASPSQLILDSQNSEMQVMTDNLGVEEEPHVPQSETLPAETPTARFTRAQLEEIASDKGIAGLREIAEPLGIKGRSVENVIEGLVKAGYASEAG